MGYRSQVVSAVIFADAAHNTESMVKWKLHCAADNRLDVVERDGSTDGIAEHITFPVIEGKHPCILLSNLNVGDWKWYDSYPDVQAWHHFIEWMHEECDAATVFLRIGEESNDVQEEYNDSERPGLDHFYPYDFFGVSRSIRIDI